jgi:hypothetical protein
MDTVGVRDGIIALLANVPAPSVPFPIKIGMKQKGNQSQCKQPPFYNQATINCAFKA